MSELNYPLPEIGEESVSADPRTLEALINIKAWANGANINTLNLVAEAVTEAKLAKESVSKEKLSAEVQTKLGEKGTGLVLTNAYSAQTERINGTSYEPSPTRPATVVLEAVEVKTTPATIEVGGVIVGRFAVSVLPQMCTFEVNPGVKWKASNGVAGATFRSSYLLR